MNVSPWLPAAEGMGGKGTKGKGGMGGKGDKGKGPAAAGEEERDGGAALDNGEPAVMTLRLLSSNIRELDIGRAVQVKTRYNPC